MTLFPQLPLSGLFYFAFILPSLFWRRSTSASRMSTEGKKFVLENFVPKKRGLRCSDRFRFVQRYVSVKYVTFSILRESIKAIYNSNPQFFLLHNCVKMSVHMEEYSTMFLKSRSQPAIKDNHSKCFVMFLVDSFV